MVKLIVDKLVKTYVQGKSIIQVLNGIDYEFHEGISYAITGESGSGKSTLLH